VSGRNDAIRQHFDELAPEISEWRRRNRYYHDDQTRHLQHLVGKNKRVLQLGCGTGDLLAALAPEYGLGIDISPVMIARARAKHPSLYFEEDDATSLLKLADQQFDFVILSDLVGYLDDIQRCLDQVRRFCSSETRVIVSYYNFLWEPILTLAEHLRLKMPAPPRSWLSPDDVANLFALAHFEVVRIDRRLLFPKFVPLVSWILNHIGNLPVINHACLTHYVVARPLPEPPRETLTTTIVVPCRNELGNIEAAVKRLPPFGRHQEIIFVDGHSTDGTQDEIRRVIAAYPDRDIKLLVQEGTGKADAVRTGFAAAIGDVLMILDADLTVPPEELRKFYDRSRPARQSF